MITPRLSIWTKAQRIHLGTWCRELPTYSHGYMTFDRYFNSLTSVEFSPPLHGIGQVLGDLMDSELYDLKVEEHA